MSTIKSSAENLTLNADGSGNDVLIQSNGSTKAIVTAEGTLGIGTTAPLRQLSLANTGSAEFHLLSGTSGNGSILFGDGLTGTDVYRGYVQYHHNGDYMLIATEAVTRLRVDSDGLKFNADTAAANALDDYEEGTWTPASSAGSASSAYGTYTKVGRLVTCNGTLTFPSQTNSSRAQVQGLPFTSLNVDHGFTGTIRYTDYNPRQIMIHGDTNATTFGLYEIDYGSAATQTSYTEISGKRFDFSLMYFTA